MRRLRQRSLEECQYVKALKPIKDKEGNTLEVFAEAVTIKAEIWPATSKLQSELYGLRIIRIQNMLYSGSENIQEGDRVTYDNETYKVISAKGKCPRIIEIEKVI